ncbi:hypothetical protein NDU88_000043 [Pleurodeles waltl]|uniref:Uncharacterized protein n=1 Tax=Pleurodeles waltl TaxID=8319 RepID=A0AAV7KUB2_PLEWA|nr:hypothetical protein NDU88_000043 [Pleurodeles waltl]
MHRFGRGPPGRRDPRRSPRPPGKYVSRCPPRGLCHFLTWATAEGQRQRSGRPQWKLLFQVPRPIIVGTRPRQRTGRPQWKHHFRVPRPISVRTTGCGGDCLHLLTVNPGDYHYINPSLPDHFIQAIQGGPGSQRAPSFDAVSDPATTGQHR